MGDLCIRLKKFLKATFLHFVQSFFGLLLACGAKNDVHEEFVSGKHISPASRTGGKDLLWSIGVAFLGSVSYF